MGREINRRSLMRGGIGAGFYAALLSDAKAAGTSRAPRLRIRQVRAIRLKNGFNSRFVRVYTEEGLTGTGECVDSGKALFGIDPYKAAVEPIPQADGAH